MADIVIIIDESGSMTSMGREPVESLNSFIEEQKVAENADDSRLSVWKFNTVAVQLLDNVPIKTAEKITDYSPGGMTALYDTIYQAIEKKRAESSVKRDVTVLIISDGINNVHIKRNKYELDILIKLMETKYNWKFIYLGANQDSQQVGGDIGITRCCNFDQAIPGSLQAITRSVSERVTKFRSGTQDDIITPPLPTSQNSAPPTIYREVDRSVGAPQPPPLRRC